MVVLFRSLVGDIERVKEWKYDYLVKKMEVRCEVSSIFVIVIYLDL